MVQRPTFIIATALTVIALAGDPVAQGAEPGTPAQRQAARRLFSEGLADADAQRWAEASDHFAGAYALTPTPEIAYNLASALTRTGEVTQAARLLGLVTDDSGARPEVREAARARLAELTPRPPRATALPEPPPRPVALAVERDAGPPPPASPSVFRRGWFWAAVGSVALASVATVVLVSRGGPGEARGNVGTWDLR